MSAGIVDVCYIALELSQRSWLVGYLLPGSEKVQSLTVAGGDTNGLLDVIARIGSKIELAGGTEAYRSRLRVCFEAGYDGFWLARFLLDRGIDTTILDPSSFLVSRRGRRVKTDRVDVEAMVLCLQADAWPP